MRKKLKPSKDIDPAVVVKQVWGLDVVSFKELESYDDRNYHCVVRNADGSETMYTLKVHNGVESVNKVSVNTHTIPLSDISYTCLISSHSHLLSQTRIERSRLPEPINAASIAA